MNSDALLLRIRRDSNLPGLKRGDLVVESKGNMTFEGDSGLVSASLFLKHIFPPPIATDRHQYRPIRECPAGLAVTLPFSQDQFLAICFELPLTSAPHYARAPCIMHLPMIHPLEPVVLDSLRSTSRTYRLQLAPQFPQGSHLFRIVSR